MALRVTWYGTLTFGLVSVPVGLAVAKSEQRTSFRQVHRGCGEPIKLKKTCPIHGDLDETEVGKAYEYAKDEFIEIEASELEALAPDSGKAISIDRFVGSTDVDPMLYGKAYYLVPAKEPVARQGYVLLLKAMEKTGTVAVATFVNLGRDHVCIVRAAHGGLMLHTLSFAEDVRDPSGMSDLLDGIKVSRDETALAVTLVNQLRGDFDHDAYKPEHRERVRALVDSLVKGTKPKMTKAKTVKPQSDVLAALKASIAATPTKKARVKV